MTKIPTWDERCEVHPDHQSGMVTNAMIQMRMQEEIDDLRGEIEPLREALQNLLDHQNGPPLGGRFGEEWQAAVDQARAALGEGK